MADWCQTGFIFLQNSSSLQLTPSAPSPAPLTRDPQGKRNITKQEIKGWARFAEILQSFSERQILWSLCLVVFHALTLKLPIQTSLTRLIPATTNPPDPRPLTRDPPRKMNITNEEIRVSDQCSRIDLVSRVLCNYTQLRNVCDFCLTCSNVPVLQTRVQQLTRLTQVI